MNDTGDQSMTPDVGSYHLDTATGRNIDLISRLHDDLLWQVFIINADMTNQWVRFSEHDDLLDWKKHALIITWSCSHVCGRWRGLILSSPSLWGRLIDLDVLDMIDPQWKDEIMRRAGQSLLTIKGALFTLSSEQHDFFLPILQEHWTQIQSLDITISLGRWVSSCVWDVLFSPAPALQTLYLYLDPRSLEDAAIPPPPTTGFLFANNAPLMRTFRSENLNLKFTPEMQWLCHIRCLDISSLTSMSINDWLRALGQMPRIEYLRLSDAFLTHPDNKTSMPLNLHCLGQIIVDSSLQACVVFLVQIIPQIGCYLHLITPHSNREFFDSADITLASEVLSRYSQNFFNSHIIATLSLSFFNAGFGVAQCKSEDLIPDPIPEPDMKTFHVDIFGVEEQLFTALTVLDAFSSCDVSSITTVTFLSYLTGPRVLLDPRVRSFLTSLRGVETILIDCISLAALWFFEDARIAAENDSDRRPIIFPKLWKVKVERIAELYLSTPHELLPFLILQRDSLAPIEVLDMMGWGDFNKPEIFDEIAGLTLIYRNGQGIHEHECQGTPLLNDGGQTGIYVKPRTSD